MIYEFAHFFQDNHNRTDLTALLVQDHINKEKVHKAPATKGGGIVFHKGEAFISYTDSFYITAMDNYGIQDVEYCEKLSVFAVTSTVYRSGLFVRKNSSLKESFNRK